jgi:hypothetical protein
MLKSQCNALPVGKAAGRGFGDADDGLGCLIWRGAEPLSIGNLVALARFRESFCNSRCANASTV